MIGVVTTCFNESEFIADAIRSVMSQTVAPLDYVVVNDGSTDGSADVIREFPHVRLLNIGNRGMPGARNAGVMALDPRAEYVFFLDGDDWMEPEAIEIVQKAIEEAPLRPDIVVPQFRLMPSGQEIEYPFKYPSWGELMCWCCISFGTIRRELFIETGGYHPAMSGDCDWDMWIDLARRGAVVEYVSEVLYNYRQHGASYTAQGDLDERWRNIAEMERHMANPVHIPKKDAHAVYMIEFNERMKRIKRDIERAKEARGGAGSPR